MLTPEEESRRIHFVVDDLSWKFPDVPAAQIESVVARAWAEFDPARIRDFVPILVNANAQKTLRANTLR